MLGFTLAEVVICVFVAALVFAGMIACYVQGAYRAEWSGYSLAAQALAIQQLEQAKSAVWDNQAFPPKNEITNIVLVTAAVLDVPIAGTNAVWATNYATWSQITGISASSSASVYMVKVDTVWPFIWKGQIRYFTNSIANYYGPDTPDS
jgi:Tfp pilus assembly protein PilV